MRGRSTKPVEETEVDLTPMLDVVFILLIFFIVTSTFIQEEALKLEPPPPANDSEQSEPQPTILVRIDGDNLVFVDRKLVDVGSVRANIERLRAETPGMPVIVQAHPEAKNGLILRIRDQAQSAQVETVNVVLDAEE